MSASNARAFLAEISIEHSPIVATGDEDGDVQNEYENTETGPVLMVRKPGESDALYRCIVDRAFNLKIMADDLLGDLGA
jgi:hypothetical protein